MSYSRQQQGGRRPRSTPSNALQPFAIKIKLVRSGIEELLDSHSPNWERGPLFSWVWNRKHLHRFNPREIFKMSEIRRWQVQRGVGYELLIPADISGRHPLPVYSDQKIVAYPFVLELEENEAKRADNRVLTNIHPWFGPGGSEDLVSSVQEYNLSDLYRMIDE